MSAMLKLTLVRNQEDRPRYITLVQYEQRWVPVNEEAEALHLVPVRRTLEWVRQGDEWALVTTRVTELPWKAIQPSPAHREFIATWVAHVKDQGGRLAAIKAGARPVAVEVQP